MKYRKVPKFWDARNLICNLPKIQTKRPNLKCDLGLHCLPRLVFSENFGSLRRQMRPSDNVDLVHDAETIHDLS